MTTSRTTRVVVAVLVQAVLVAVAVWAPLSARVTGEEVRLRVQPVDPVDPFRGAYVDLGYPDLPGQPGLFGEPGEIPPENPDVDERGTAYVPLVREGEVWVGGPLVRTRPAEGPYLRCDDSDWRLRCGIESLFLPQDEAKAMEDAVATGGAVATVRVDSWGNAALLGVDPG